MAEPLRRADTPPPKGPKTWVRRIKAGPGFTGEFVSASVWGVFTHWDGSRTRECYANPEKCAYCQRSMPNRWRGYVYVWNAAYKEYEFLELTQDAVEEIWRQVGKDTDLKGSLWEIKRHGKNDKGKIVVFYKGEGREPDSLPEALDPEETLRTLWGWMTHR